MLKYKLLANLNRVIGGLRNYQMIRNPDDKFSQKHHNSARIMNY